MSADLLLFTVIYCICNGCSDNSIATSRIPLLAAVGGSMVTRTASRRAFAKEGRGLVTEDILPEIGTSFAEVFGEHSSKL